MRANCWMGRKKVEVQNVPDPRILMSGDAIVKVTSTAICGSDLHIYDGYIPTMEKGDVLGHEFMGEVVEVGRGVERLKIGDRVAMLLTPRPETAAAFLGTFKAGAILLSLSVLYGDDGIRHRVTDSQSRVLVTNAENAERVRALGLPVEHVLVLDDDLVATGDPAFARVDTAADDPARRIHQTHDRESGDGLAGPRFADDPEHLASGEVEADAADRSHRARFGGEADGEVLHAEDRAPRSGAPNLRDGDDAHATARSLSTARRRAARADRADAAPVR